MVVCNNVLKARLADLRLEGKTENVYDIIETYVTVFNKVNANIHDTTIYIVDSYVTGLDYFHTFQSKQVISDYLDASYSKMRNMVIAEEWEFNFILLVRFVEDEIQVIQMKYTEFINTKFETLKVKTWSYGVTDTKSVVKVNISQNDVKGITYIMFRDIVSYTFRKKTKKDTKDLRFIITSFTP